MKRSLAIFMLLFGLAAATFARAEADPEVARQAAALGAEGPALRSFLTRSAAQGVSRDFVLEVLKDAQALEARGIPAEPYLLKANEGLAKGVPPIKIRPALQQTQRRSETAARLVDGAVARGARGDSPQARRKAILQYQSALLNGVSPAELEKNIAKLEQGAGSKASLEQIGSEARAAQPRRHVLAPVQKAPKPKFTPVEPDSSPKHKVNPLLEKEEKGRKSGKPSWKAKEDRGSPQLGGREDQGKEGKDPWKSKENPGNRGQEKGKKK